MPFKGGIMKPKEKGNKFTAEPDTREFERLKTKTWLWVPKLQLMAGFILISQLMTYAYTTEGWKAYLSKLIAIGVFYLFVSAIMDRIMMYIEAHEREIDNLQRRFTHFICDASLGRVKKEDLERLARAADWFTGSRKEDDLSVDDFSLIARAGYFWQDKIGFRWQDEAICINCKQERREHSKDGSCPTKTT